MRQNALCKTLHLCGRREVRGTRLRMHAVQVTRRLPHCQTDQGPQLYPSLCSIPLYLSLPIVLSLWMPLSVLYVCASVCPYLVGLVCISSRVRALVSVLTIVFPLLIPFPPVPAVTEAGRRHTNVFQRTGGAGCATHGSGRKFPKSNRTLVASLECVLHRRWIVKASCRFMFVCSVCRHASCRTASLVQAHTHAGSHTHRHTHLGT